MIIHKYIAHVLDKNTESLILNDFEGRINPDVDKFLSKTIRKVVKNDYLRKAKFKNYENNEIKNLCEAIIYDERMFLENSKKIAANLFDVMGINLDMESCDLVVCLYTQKDEKRVAIIKLDYKSLYNHHISLEDDKFNIQIIQNETGILANAKVKQSVIVGVSGMNDDYDLVVLDVDAEKYNQKSPFRDDFLDIRTIQDDTYKTKVFEVLTNNWITNAYGEDIKRAENARSIRNYMLKENSVMDIDKFLEVAIDENLKSSLVEYLEDNDVESDFNIDKKVIEKRLRQRHIKTDTGFDIKGSYVDFEDTMKYSIKENTNGSYDLVIKNVRFYEEK